MKDDIFDICDGNYISDISDRKDSLSDISDIFARNDWNDSLSF